MSSDRRQVDVFQTGLQHHVCKTVPQNRTNMLSAQRLDSQADRQCSSALAQAAAGIDMLAAQTSVARHEGWRRK